jgi:hypothetical protein
MIEASLSPPRVARAEAAPVPPATRFGSLGAMRSAHRELLRRRSAGAAEFRHSIDEFLGRGSTTGQILSSAAERDDAQSMLDYWTASLCAEGHKSRDVPLDDFNLAETQRLAHDVEQWFAWLPAEEQEALRSILLRLMRSNERPQPASQPLRLEALCRLGLSQEVAMQAVQQGESAGLIYRSPGDTPENDQVEIANEAILQNWPRFEQWLQEERHRLNERRQLTAAARLWVSHGRDAGSLLGGTALQAVTQYHELSPLETEFIRASQQYAQQQVEKNLAEAQTKLNHFRFWATACSLLAALALWFAWLSRNQTVEIQRLSEYYLATLVMNLRMELRLSEELFERLPEHQRQAPELKAYRPDREKLARLKEEGYLSPKPTGPGMSIGVPSNGTAGSVCCVLENMTGQYILTSSHLLTNLTSPQYDSASVTILQPSPIDVVGSVAGPLEIARFSVPSVQTLRPFAFARLLDRTHVQATNHFPNGNGKIVGIADVRIWNIDQWDAIPGIGTGDEREVHLFGAGSGHKIGKLRQSTAKNAYFLRITDEEGNPISSPGDSGAPLLIQSREQKSKDEYSLIGMLYRKGEGGKDSMVIPIQRVLDEVAEEFEYPLGLLEEQE